MTEEIVGDILDAPEEVIVHAVSKTGEVDDEISKKFYEAYPKSKQAYDKFIENVRNNRLGNRYKQALQTSVFRTDRIGNSFLRTKFLAGVLCRQTANDNEVDIDTLREAFWCLYETHLSFAIPYKFGMNISDEQWEKILYLLDIIYCDKIVTIYRPSAKK